MSFREKMAWISLLANLAIYGFYFAALAAALGRGGADAAHFTDLLIGSVVLLVVVTVVLSIIVAAWAPKEAQAAEDEREKRIALEASHAAYFVISAGAVMVIAALYFGISDFLAVNALFFVLVAGELTKNAAQIFQFRRGA